MENGYRGTTIRAVCADAGTSLAILHRNWPGKEALFTEVFRDISTLCTPRKPNVLPRLTITPAPSNPVRVFRAGI